VVITLVFGIPASERIFVSEIVDSGLAGFQNDRIATIGAGKRSLRLVREICGNDPAGGVLVEVAKVIASSNAGSPASDWKPAIVWKTTLKNVKLAKIPKRPHNKSGFSCFVDVVFIFLNGRPFRVSKIWV
jgi:hypothetical protein